MLFLQFIYFCDFSNSVHILCVSINHFQCVVIPPNISASKCFNSEMEKQWLNYVSSKNASLDVVMMSSFYQKYQQV